MKFVEPELILVTAQLTPLIEGVNVYPQNPPTVAIWPLAREPFVTAAAAPRVQRCD
ncbi:MAG: hypothetical protein KBF98_16530 [Rhodoferax sp.]|nr:hypothetical protein [Rhodoferax sp.]